ncbi:MAG: GspE/PulE family protein [Gammaproteobacteria bacterium]
MATRQEDVIFVRRKVRIGDLLIEEGVITDDQLKSALDEQQRSGKKLGETLVDLGYIAETELLSLLSRQLNVPLADLKNHHFDEALVHLLPETHAKHFRSIVLEDMGDSFLVGMVEPTDLFATDELTRILKKPIRTAIISESDLLNTIDSIYQGGDDLSTIAEALGQEMSSDDTVDEAGADEDISSAPVVKLLHSIFTDAIRMNASDIHIEPGENELRIRQRVDGLLHEKVMPEKKIAPALISRLKLMSNLDISEKRLPQDGRFNIKVSNRSIDVRLSTMPMQYGESVVMRLLDQSKSLLSMEQLGMPEDLQSRLTALIKRPNGMVLVTGPTGSGKTTTLYSALTMLNEPEHKIITVEDPIEYRLPRINQVQINTKIDLTFSKVLRTTLRQDPDVIMVGEMRDKETAEIGLRAAMTGHFVLSTLHTNDAISTVNRLMDMGAEGYLVASALRGVLAQRLVRRICEECKTEYEPSVAEKEWLKEKLGDQADHAHMKKGAGCNRCRKTGYSGRVGVYELLELNEQLAEALSQNDTHEFERRAKALPNFTTFTEFTLNYALKGITTLDEVFRISDGV